MTPWNNAQELHLGTVFFFSYITNKCSSEIRSSCSKHWEIKRPDQWHWSIGLCVLKETRRLRNRSSFVAKRVWFRWTRKHGVVHSKRRENKSAKVKWIQVMCALYTGEGEGESPAAPEWVLLALPVFSQAHRCLIRRFSTGSFGKDFHPFGLNFCILGTY